MLAGCRDTPAVQLVERPQIAMAGLLGVYSSGAERIFYALQYRPISVIALNDRLDVGHACLPLSWSSHNPASLEKCDSTIDFARASLFRSGEISPPIKPECRYLSSQTSSIRAPLAMLLTIIVRPFT